MGRTRHTMHTRCEQVVQKYIYCLIGLWYCAKVKVQDSTKRIRRVMSTSSGVTTTRF